jgi:hypothetical protein
MNPKDCITNRCPTCRQKTLPQKGVRYCYSCGKPIIRKHKWMYIQVQMEGRLITVVAHRICEDPESYHRR